MLLHKNGVRWYCGALTYKSSYVLKVPRDRVDIQISIRLAVPYSLPSPRIGPALLTFWLLGHCVVLISTSAKGCFFIANVYAELVDKQ